MATELEETLGEKCRLIAGENGVFDLLVDGVVVFSKQQHGEFIPAKEILELVKKHLEI